MGAAYKKLHQDDTNLETYSVIWLDSSSHTSEETSKAQQRLRISINQLKIFEDYNQCEDYIRSISSEDRLILIVDDRSARQIVPRIEQLRQVSSIYIHSLNKNIKQQWAEQYLKIKCVNNNLNTLVTRIQSEHKIDDLLSVVIYNTNEFNSNFIYSNLLFDCLFRMSSNNKTEFLSLCKIEYKDNENELNIIHQFEQNYSSNHALSWYTRKSFIYRILNKALRIQNIDLLFQLRFFLQDIYHQIKHYQCICPIRVYRNHLMTYEDIQLFKNSIGQFILLNTFLSASLDRGLALFYLYESNDLERVLFEIDADPQLDGAKIFGNNSYEENEQIIFMVGSIFEIENIFFNDDEIWIIQLKLSTENHNQLKPIFDILKTEYHYKQNLFSFGQFLFKQNDFNQAEKYYLRLLNECLNETKDTIQCYNELGKLAKIKQDYELSIQWFNKSIKIEIENDFYLIESYNQLGEIYQKKGDYKQVIESYNKALIIFIKNFGDDHPKLAICLNNIAIAYKNEKKYIEAIEHHQKALIILEKHQPNNYSDLAVSHNNIGVIYRHLSHYDLALTHYQYALEIYKKSLSFSYEDIAKTFRNLGLVYEDKSDLKQSLLCFQKAAILYRHTLPSEHPDLLIIEEKIQFISSQLK